MTQGRATSIPAREIALFLGSTLNGDDVSLIGVSSLKYPGEQTLVFLGKPTAENIRSANTTPGVVCICQEESVAELTCSTIAVADPRFEFARVVAEFFCDPQEDQHLGGQSAISPAADLHDSVVIEPFARVGPNVEIGPDTVVRSHAVLVGDVRIGRNCTIGYGASIGGPGFGYVKDQNGVGYRFPHIGSVIVGDNVEIGSNCTIARGTIDSTSLGDNVKVDDRVHISHNCEIGPRTMIAASASISGSVTIGPDVWIGTGAVITNWVEVGDRAFVGVGSVVITGVGPGRKVFGNPAIPIRKGEAE